MKIRGCLIILSSFLSFFVLAQTDIEKTVYMGDDSYLVFQHPKEFTYSSVKGDFRIIPFKDSYAVAWKNFIIVRDIKTGAFIWKKSDYGRYAASNPEKTKIVAVSRSKKLNIFDIATGKALLTTPIITDDYINYLVWNKDQKIIALSHEYIYIFNEKGKLLEKIELTFADEIFLHSLMLSPNNPNHIIFIDNRSKQLIKFDILTKNIVKKIEISSKASEICPTDDNQFFAVGYSTNFLKIYDTNDFKEVISIRNYGKRGVQSLKENAPRYGSQYQRYKHTIWASIPDISPDKSKVLINDTSGQLYLFEVSTGKQIKVFDRTHLDFVYDVKWLNNQDFIAILNQGNIVKMNINEHQPAYYFNDFEEN